MSNSIDTGLSAALDFAWKETGRLRSELNRRNQQVCRLMNEKRKLVAENINLTRFRSMLADEDAEGAREAAVSMAAKATLELDRARGSINFLEERNANLQRLLRDYRETIEEALRSLKAPDCESCLGSGEVEIEVDGYGSIADETPPTHMERTECEECAGIGLDWSAASEGSAS